MKKLIAIAFFLFLGLQVSGQEIMRSTVGSSGSSTELKSGDRTYVIQQSVGQSSVTGSFFYSDRGLIQGFIQPPIKLGATVSDNTIDAVVYPNPFKSAITVAFNETLEGALDVIVYDMLGKVVFQQERKAGNSLVLDLDFLSTAQYVLLITSEEKNFKANILKN